MLSNGYHEVHRQSVDLRMCGLTMQKEFCFIRPFLELPKAMYRVRLIVNVIFFHYFIIWGKKPLCIQNKIQS